MMFAGTILKRDSYALIFVFFTAMLLFWLLAATKWSGESEIVQKVTGVEGIICGLSATYTAFGLILNEVSGRRILPLGIQT